MRNFNSILNGIGVCVVILVIVVIGMLAQSGDTNPSVAEDYTDPHVIREDISIRYDAGGIEKVTLPARIQTEVPFTVDLDISAYEDVNGKTIALMLGYLDVVCYAGERQIYSDTLDVHTHENSGGYRMHMIDLPEDLEATSLVFRFIPRANGNTVYTVPAFVLGNRLNIVLNYFLKRDAFELFVILVLFLVAFISFAVTVLRRVRAQNPGTFIHIGLLCVDMAIYFATRLWSINYLLAGVHVVLYFLEYTALMLLAAPALAMLRGRLNPGFDKWFTAGIAASLINVVVQYTFIMLQWSEFRSLSVLTQLILMYAVLIIAVAFLNTDGRVHQEKRALMISLMPLLVNTIVGVISYWVYGQLAFINLLLLGVVAFVSIQSYNAVHTYLDLQRQSVKKQIYKEMALMDALTRLGNRTAYNAHLQRIETSPMSQGIISIDLNNLKAINDTYGHLSGDRMIMAFSKILKGVFRGNSRARLFRPGGDEFMIFLEEGRAQEMATYIRQLKKAAATYSVENPDTAISFAAGYALYASDSEMNLEDAIHRADQMMYEDKRPERRRYPRGVSS